MLSSSIAFQSGCCALDCAVRMAAEVTRSRTENDFAIVINDSSRWRPRSEITLARAHRHARRRDTHLQRVHLAIELVRCEAERVLMMQLVDNALEGRREIVGGGELEIAAAGRFGDFRQPFVRLVAHLVPPAAAVTARTTVAPVAAVPAPAAAAPATTAAAAAPATAAAARISHSAAMAAAERRHRTGEADGVHHHVLFLGALH